MMVLALNPRPVSALNTLTASRITVSVPAGYPSPAQDYETESLDLNAHLIRDRVSTFVLRASGHSMEGAGISDGDELIVNRATTPQHGHVVVAVLDGELTVKRLQITAHGVILKAENAGFPDIRVPSLSELRIWGVVQTCLHHL